jgi:heat shock protein HslJ
LRQRYPDLLPANADPALVHAIEGLDTAAQTMRETMTPPAWLTQLTWEQPTAPHAAPVGAQIPAAVARGPVAARVVEAVDHVSTRASRWRPWAELAAALVIFGLIAALLALVLRPSAEAPGLAGAGASPSATAQLNAAGARLPDAESAVAYVRSLTYVFPDASGYAARIVSVQLATLGVARANGNGGTYYHPNLEGIPDMPVWNIEIDHPANADPCPAGADPMLCLSEHFVLTLNAVTGETLTQTFPDSYQQGQPTGPGLPLLAPDATIDDLDAALTRAHELAPGVVGRPSRAIGAWLLPRGQSWARDSGDAQSLVWQVELLDASDLPTCASACPRDHLTLLIDPATGAELARRDGGPAPAVTLAPWPTPRPATPDPNSLVVPPGAALQDPGPRALDIARDHLGAQHPTLAQVSLTTPQQALYVMQDRGVAVTPLWDPSEANEVVYWIELVGDVFRNPDCASCPDAPKAYMGLRPSDGALLWLATEIPPDVATHTPTPPPTPTPAVSPTPVALDPALLNTSWTLAALDGEQTLAGRPPTITFYDAALDIFSGCNYVSAPYLAASDGTLILGRWVSTAMACIDPAAAAQETRFRDLLFAVARYRLAGATLRLEAADGRALIFSRAEGVLPAAKPTGTVVLPTEEPLPPLPTGIFDHYDGAGSSIFRTVNYWQGMTSDGFKMVLAGRSVSPLTDRSGPGALRVDNVPTDARGASTGEQQVIGVFTPSVDHGALRITRVEGDTLYLAAEDGTALTFDMLTLTFGVS